MIRLLLLVVLVVTGCATPNTFNGRQEVCARECYTAQNECLASYRSWERCEADVGACLETCY